MRLPAYKTNRLLWLALSIICFFVIGPGIDFVSGLFSGDLRFKDLTSFDFIGPSIFSIVLGWLLQCAIIIILSWMRKGSNPPQ